MAETIAVLSLKGGTGKTTTVRTLTDVFRRSGSTCSRSTSTRRATCRTTSTSPPDATPTIADVLAGDAKAKAAVHDGIIPATPILAEVGARAGGKMGRELVLRRALKDARKSYDIMLIDCPPALGLLTVNALVAADWALHHRRGAVLRAAGRRAGARGDRAGEGDLNPDLEWLGVVLNIADMRTVPLARGVRRADGALRREGLRHRHPPVDRLRGVGRAGASRSSTTGPTSAPTTSRSPTRCSSASGSRTPRRKLRPAARGARGRASA